MRAVAEKPRDAVVKLDTYRNVQRHRAVLPAVARHLVSRSYCVVGYAVIHKHTNFLSTIRGLCMTLPQTHYSDGEGPIPSSLTLWRLVLSPLQHHWDPALPAIGNGPVVLRFPRTWTKILGSSTARSRKTAISQRQLMRVLFFDQIWPFQVDGKSTCLWIT